MQKNAQNIIDLDTCSVLELKGVVYDLERQRDGLLEQVKGIEMQVSAIHNEINKKALLLRAAPPNGTPEEKAGSVRKDPAEAVTK